MEHHKKLAMLVGGGPAPGINSVIGAATIRAALDGMDVIGVRDGFEWLMHGDIEHVTPLTIDAVSRIHFRGGSHIGISRANPTANPQASRERRDLAAATRRDRAAHDRRRRHGVLGDEGRRDAPAAAFTWCTCRRRSTTISICRPTVDTFGFQTARHYGAEIVKNLMVDAKTTSRWYFVITMGRKAGHLALGIGKAAGATLTLIPEEFPKPLRLKTIVDTLVGAIIKRLSYGRRDGVAMIAEGVVLDVDPSDLSSLHEVERDAHGNLRIAEVNIGEILKAQVAARLKAARREGDARRQEHRLRAPVRRPDSLRHGVHARPGLLRGQVPPRRRQRGDDLDAGRPLRADPVPGAARQRDRPARDYGLSIRVRRATPSRAAT